jgi:hypothetical protein
MPAMAASARSNPLAAMIVAGLTGFAVWAVLSFAGGRMYDGRYFVPEAWDTPAYFSFGVPILLAGAAVAGFLAPVRVWRWALAVVAGHVVAMVLIHPPGTGLGLLPLAIVLIGLPMTFILTVAATVGGVIGRRGWSGSILV